MNAPDTLNRVLEPIQADGSMTGRSNDRRQEITPQLLLKAYSCGLFPMAELADDPELFWVEPEMRGVIPLDRFHVPRSLAKVVRSGRFELRRDTAFEEVMAECAAATADRPSTWINSTIRRLYSDLFHLGHAHTVEAWRDDRLVGGLYGVSLGAAFFGESMFSRETDASKVCLVHLVDHLRERRLPAAGHAIHHRAPQAFRRGRRSAAHLRLAARRSARGPGRTILTLRAPGPSSGSSCRLIRKVTALVGTPPRFRRCMFRSRRLKQRETNHANQENAPPLRSHTSS